MTIVDGSLWQDRAVRWIGVVLVAGCFGKAPPAVENTGVVRTEPASRLTYRVFSPRPALDMSWLVPDFHEELRWPLSAMSHPSLEPRFAVAQQLGIGVTWDQLCSRGVHKRVSATQKELLSYLHGWCDVQKRDVDSACAHLTPLLGSMTLGLRPAVRHDLANILADHGGAEKAEHWLSKHNIRDVETLDILAATYVEVGMAADAFAINARAIDSDNYATPATKCRRLAKRIVIGHEANPQPAINELNDLALKPKLPDPVCKRVWTKIACWRYPETGCHQYIVDEKIDYRASNLLAAYYSWPFSADAWTWWTTVERARTALGMHGAAELLVTAAELAVRAFGYCPAYARAPLHEDIANIRVDPANAALEPRLKKLAQDCPTPAQPKAATTIYPPPPPRLPPAPQGVTGPSPRPPRPPPPDIGPPPRAVSTPLAPPTPVPAPAVPSPPTP
ncbi:MAG TPA: hypothetical protein VIV11_22900 [Kofleriaceae bacterium]